MQTIVELVRVLSIISAVIAGVSWKLSPEPAIFGKEVKLTCCLTSSLPCCNTSTRRWSAGKNLLVMDGESTNATKYSEILNVTANTSTLLIKQFNEEDIDKSYECSYGFSTFSKVLQISEDKFEFHPLEKLPFEMQIDEDNYLELNITLKKIFPVPQCKITDGEKNDTSNVQVITKPSGMLYSASIYTYYNFRDKRCRTFVVLCCIGQTEITIARKYVSCESGSGCSGLLAGLLIAVICVCSFGIISLVGFLIRSCFRRRKLDETKENTGNSEQNETELQSIDDIGDRTDTSEHIAEEDVFDESQKPLNIESTFTKHEHFDDENIFHGSQYPLVRNQQVQRKMKKNATKAK